MTITRYTVVFEPPTSTIRNWGAYVPDIPGCVGLGDTKEECRASLDESFRLHAEDYRERGVPLPAPTSVAETLDMAA